MKTKKGIKTTITEVVFAIVFIAILIYYFSTPPEVMDTEALVIALTAWTAVCKFVLGYFAKDATASHTKDKGHPDPDDDEDD